MGLIKYLTDDLHFKWYTLFQGGVEPGPTHRENKTDGVFENCVLVIIPGKNRLKILFVRFHHILLGRSNQRGWAVHVESDE